MLACRDSSTYASWLAINGKGHELSSCISELSETVSCRVSCCVLCFSKERAVEEERDSYRELGDVKCSE